MTQALSLRSSRMMNVAIAVFALLAFVLLKFRYPVLDLVFHDLFRYATDERRFEWAEQQIYVAGLFCAVITFFLVLLKYISKTRTLDQGISKIAQGVNTQETTPEKTA